MSAQYRLKTDRYSSHRQITNYILSHYPNGAFVLDVGCGEGNIGTLLTKQFILTGIDISRTALARSPDNYVSRIAADLNVFDWKLNKRFDIICAADVLEHLVDPETVVNKFSRLLKPNGILIVSLPNIAFISVRLGLLCGNFPKHDIGICDQTHLHWFTKSSTKIFLKRCGFDIVTVRPTVPPFQFIFPNFPSSIQDLLYVFWYGLTLLRSTVFGYQFIYYAKKISTK